MCRAVVANWRSDDRSHTGVCELFINSLHKGHGRLSCSHTSFYSLRIVGATGTRVLSAWVYVPILLSIDCEIAPRGKFDCGAGNLMEIHVFDRLPLFPKRQLIRMIIG